MTDWSKYTRLTVRLSPDVIAQIRKAADAEGETVSRFIRRTLQEAMTESETVEVPATQ